MFSCEFKLNDQPISKLSLTHAGKLFSYPAFSGFGPHVNRRVDACLNNVGPIPPGRYYILNRQSGGRLGWLRDLYQDRSDWFSLYAIDSKIDDETWCESVKRGEFRLHPKGTFGISEGCIVVDQMSKFVELRALLMSKPAQKLDGLNFAALGIVEVA